MNYRIIFVSALLFLAACNDSRETEQSTFVPPNVEPVKPVPVVDPVPPDGIVEDKTLYSGAIDANVDISLVSETPSVKNHEMTIKGKTVKYTARAGHLIAYAPSDPKDPAKKDAQAAIFYMAYTRDDLPKENRPVTFFFNGGPGSASVWLHLGSWAPKRLKTSIPNIPKEFYAAKPQSMPWIDNEETLLDKTDLVFLDPTGTGLSTAIAPHTNVDFWGMDVDARIDVDFITRYINYYNRQSSPKYIYGESYGGIRAPIMANLMEAAGTTNFEPDPSGKKPIVLSGIVLNSPILNYETNCGQGGDISCAGLAPTFAMTGEYYGIATRRGQLPKDEFVNGLRTFVTDQYNPAFAQWYYPGRGTIKGMAERAQPNVDWFYSSYFDKDGVRDFFAQNPQRIRPNIAIPLANWFIANPADRPAYIDAFGTDVDAGIARYAQIARDKEANANSPDWREYIGSEPGVTFQTDMNALTGLNVNWETAFNMSDGTFLTNLLPDSNFGIYDARANIPKEGGYDITFYEDEAFQAAIKTVLPDVFNYHNDSLYSTLGDDINRNWRYERVGKQLNARSSLPDLVSTLNYDPSVKLLALHGYYDMVTPFHQTELDLAGAGLGRRIPVKNFEGGHMFYYAEEARAPAKQALDEFYDAPAYDPKPASLVTNTTTALN
jgi:carboxypeptidase C (cathepsin A)